MVVLARCKISSPSWTVSLCSEATPLKILLTIRGLSPCREPFPPSRLKPSPAEVFSRVAGQTVASAVDSMETSLATEAEPEESVEELTTCL